MGGRRATDSQGSRTALVGLFLLLAVGIGAAGLAFLRVDRAGRIRDAEASLSVVADMKVAQIEGWLQERRLDGRLMLSPPLLERIRRFREDPEGPHRSELLAWLRDLKRQPSYVTASLCDPEGRALLSTDAVALSDFGRRLVSEAMTTREIILSDFHDSPENRGRHLDLVVPLLDPGSTAARPLGCLLVGIDPERFLFPLLRSWPVPTRTAETYLARREGEHVLFLSELRHRHGAALKLRRDLRDGRSPAALAALGRRGVVSGVDYRGVQVKAAMRGVAETPWVLVAKIDEEEIHGPLRRRAMTVSIVALLAIAASGAGIALVDRRRQALLFRQRYEDETRLNTQMRASEAALRESEERFRSTFEQAAVGIAHVGLDGRWIRVNRKLCDIVGYPREELLEKTFQDITHPEDLETDLMFVRQVLAGEIQNYAMEKRYLRKDGAVVWINLTVALVRDERGAPAFFISVVEDITDRKLSQEALRAHTRLVGRSASGSAADLLRGTLEEIGALTGSPAGYFHLVEADQRTLTLLSWSTSSGHESRLHEDGALRRDAGEAGIWAECLRERRPVVRNDGAPTDPAGLPQGHPVTLRELAVPIVKQERVVAILGLGDKPTDYTERDLALTAYLAGAAWEILERLRAAETILRQYRVLEGINRIFFRALGCETERDLGRVCLAVAEEVTGSRFGLIAELGEDGMLRDIAISDPGWELCSVRVPTGHAGPRVEIAPRGLLGRALRDGVAFFANDPPSHPDAVGLPEGHPPLRSFLAAPLRGDRGVIGMVGLGNREGGYGSEDATALEALGVAVAQVFIRKRAEWELAASRELLTLRARIADVFLAHSDEEMYDLILGVLLEAFESPYGVFGYLDERGDMVVPTMTRHIWDRCAVPDKDIVFPRAEWGESTWPRAIREKRAIRMNTPSTRVPQGHVPIVRHISLPILYRGEAIGLFQVANRDRDYREEDLRLLEAIANHVAPILWTRLHRDLEERARREAEAEVRQLNRELEQRVRDRTAQLQAANQELEGFSYSVSHDLRAPLRHLTGFVELLRKSAPELDASGRHYLEVIEGAAASMGRLIDDLLSFSRMGRGEMLRGEVSLADVLGEALESLRAETQGRNVEWQIGELPRVSGDAAMLRQVFVNLLSNALKFTKPREVARIEVGAERAGGELVVHVRDNGVGFDPRYAGKLFTLFQRLHRAEEFEGTGVGLASLRRIVHRHGGRTWAEGAVGAGATVFFTLPANEGG